MHWARRAASRAAWTAGNKSAIKTAMMAITTSNSIRVKAGRKASISSEISSWVQLSVQVAVRAKRVNEWASRQNRRGWNDRSVVGLMMDHIGRDATGSH